jgi:hypothetical protein
MISDREGLLWLRHRLRNTGERFRETKLYMLLKKELSLLGYWKNRPRGNPKKGYKAMVENKKITNS